MEGRSGKEQLQLHKNNLLLEFPEEQQVPVALHIPAAVKRISGRIYIVPEERKQPIRTRRSGMPDTPTTFPTRQLLLTERIRKKGALAIWMTFYDR